MNSSYVFLAEIGMGFIMSISVIVILRKPLTRLLEDICGTADRARFWVTYTNLMLVITPLMVNSILGSSQHLAVIDATWCRTTVNYSLMGIFLSLLIVGYQIRRAVPQKVAGGGECR